ncbi:LysR family transcriptional regulator [Duganella sp. BuS-21]|uniref:LysR family transcriptional regulator n=1 Tax=Duganella sp. BuS-21 TaxID=2943848 RepID=UPI0035A6885D
MDQIHLMNVFVVVGEGESFAAAARRLDLSPAAVTRAISGLEDQLGVALLLRTTRSVRLTQAGRRYLDDCRNILASIAEANQTVAAANAASKGNLSVAVSDGFGKDLIMPCIVRFLNEFPEVEVSAYFLDRVVNLVEEEMDVAVRIGHLPDSSLKALRVGQVRPILCAAPGYLLRHGVPQHPADLLRHTVIASSEVSPRVEWKFGGGNDPIVVRVKPRLMVTSNEAVIDAAVGGLGICRLLSCQVGNELCAGRLQPILADYEGAPLPVHVLHRESKFGPSRVRKFIDILVAHLRAHGHLNTMPALAGIKDELICA